MSFELMMVKRCSVSPQNSMQKWLNSRLTVYSQLYLMLLVLLTPHSEPSLSTRLSAMDNSETLGHQSTSAATPTNSHSSHVPLGVTLLASGSETPSKSAIDCLPLRNLIANRFSRSPMKKLRMLRDDGDIRDMEHLIRTHYNCLLKDDRIRFKKSGGQFNSARNSNIDQDVSSLVQSQQSQPKHRVWPSEFKPKLIPVGVADRLFPAKHWTSILIAVPGWKPAKANNANTANYEQMSQTDDSTYPFEMVMNYPRNKMTSSSGQSSTSDEQQNNISGSFEV